MSLFNTPEFKVGALVIAVSTLIATMSLKVAEGPGILSGEHTYWFAINDAGGLVKNSAVKMAGIKVGVIDDIELSGSKAKVKIRVKDTARVTPSSQVELKADGILGDRHVELTPGPAQEEILADGAEIQTTLDRGNMGDVLAEVSKLTKSLNQLATTFNKAAMGDGDPTTPIGRIVLNLEKLSQDLTQITGRNREKLSEIVDMVHSLSRNLNTYVSPQTLARLDQTVKNIEEVTDKINRGEGTLGRLINDEQTVQELNSAITNVNKFLGGADKMETSIDFHSEYLTNVSLTKSYLGVKIQPGLDRYYEIAVIDDPRGVVKSEREEKTTGGSTNIVDTTTTYKNKVKFTALFAKNFYDFTIKGGLIENSGGVGVDYHLFDRKLRFSVEMFNFSNLYMRAFVRYNFFKGVYLIAGGDNLTESNHDRASAFIGGGIFITNDDLKLLASKVSIR
ncbi:MAG: MlaD family protein [Bdellovibrionales bacterium]|nr:MlaD family protein [Bdellovibrionales bacterium]